MVRLALLLALVAGTAAAQDDWYPSKYGAQDSLGALNLLSPERVVEAAKLIKTGKTYALGVNTGPETPAFGTRSYNIVTMSVGDGSGGSLGTNKMTFTDDLVSTWVGIGSQIDGLGHLGIDNRYYNGAHVSEFLRTDGLTRFSTHELPPIVTRGVLLDIAALQGKDLLPGGTAINRAEIDGALARQNTELREGDVVLIHTGWLPMSERSPEMFLATAPGLGIEGAEYLAEKGAVAVGADTWCVEVLPSEDEDQAYPVHQHLLAKNGVYILENMDTSALAADRGYEFLFVLGQPKLVGSVQAIINPVAIR